MALPRDSGVVLCGIPILLFLMKEKKINQSKLCIHQCEYKVLWVLSALEKYDFIMFLMISICIEIM